MWTTSFSGADMKKQWIILALCGLLTMSCGKKTEETTAVEEDSSAQVEQVVEENKFEAEPAADPEEKAVPSRDADEYKDAVNQFMANIPADAAIAYLTTREVAAKDAIPKIGQVMANNIENAKLKSHLGLFFDFDKAVEDWGLDSEKFDMAAYYQSDNLVLMATVSDEAKFKNSLNKLLEDMGPKLEEIGVTVKKPKKGKADFDIYDIPRNDKGAFPHPDMSLGVHFAGKRMTLVITSAITPKHENFVKPQANPMTKDMLPQITPETAILGNYNMAKLIEIIGTSRILPDFFDGTPLISLTNLSQVCIEEAQDMFSIMPNILQDIRISGDHPSFTTTYVVADKDKLEKLQNLHVKGIRQSRLHDIAGFELHLDVKALAEVAESIVTEIAEKPYKCQVLAPIRTQAKEYSEMLKGDAALKSITDSVTGISAALRHYAPGEAVPTKIAASITTTANAEKAIPQLWWLINDLPKGQNRLEITKGQITNVEFPVHPFNIEVRKSQALLTDKGIYVTTPEYDIEAISKTTATDIPHLAEVVISDTLMLDVMKLNYENRKKEIAHKRQMNPGKEFADPVEPKSHGIPGYRFIGDVNDKGVALTFSVIPK